jgi:hypothetical protein
VGKTGKPFTTTRGQARWKQNSVKPKGRRARRKAKRNSEAKSRHFRDQHISIPTHQLLQSRELILAVLKNDPSCCDQSWCNFSKHIISEKDVSDSRKEFLMSGNLHAGQDIVLRKLQQARVRKRDHSCSHSCTTSCRKKWKIIYRVGGHHVCYTAFLRIYGGRTDGWPGQGGLSRNVLNRLANAARLDQPVLTVLPTSTRLRAPISDHLGAPSAGCSHKRGDSTLADLFWHDFVRRIKESGRVHLKNGKWWQFATTTICLTCQENVRGTRF